MVVLVSGVHSINEWDSPLVRAPVRAPRPYLQRRDEVARARFVAERTPDTSTPNWVPHSPDSQPPSGPTQPGCRQTTWIPHRKHMEFKWIDRVSAGGREPTWAHHGVSVGFPWVTTWWANSGLANVGPTVGLPMWDPLLYFLWIMNLFKPRETGFDGWKLGVFPKWTRLKHWILIWRTESLALVRFGANKMLL